MNLANYCCIHINWSKSYLAGLDKLLSHPQEIVLLVGSFLDYVEESILDDYLCYLAELVV
jgi:hypothetical protein